jgi:hypothetical protein
MFLPCVRPRSGHVSDERTIEAMLRPLSPPTMQPKLTALVQPILDVVTYYRTSSKRMMMLELSHGAHAELAPLSDSELDSADLTPEERIAELQRREDDNMQRVAEFLSQKYVKSNCPVDKVSSHGVFFQVNGPVVIMHRHVVPVRGFYLDWQFIFSCLCSLL